MIGLPRRWTRIVRDALWGDPAGSLLGPSGPLLAIVTVALYAGIAIGLASYDVAVSFAIVPLVIAAMTLGPRAGMLAAASVLATVGVAEAVARRADLDAVEAIELAAICIVSLALRFVVVRLSRGRSEIARTAAQLASTRAQVEEAREATERWVAQLEVAQRAAARMTGRRTVREVAEAVADEIRAIVDYHACRVYLLEEPDDLVPVLAVGTGGYASIPREILALKVGEGFAGWVAASGRPLLVPDSSEDPRGLPIPGTDDFDESMVVVPMRYDDRVTGVIALAKMGLRQFDLADLRILSILADQAATAVESTRALSASSDLAGNLRRIADMSSALSRSLDSRRVADLIAEHLGRAIGADECSISTWERPANRLHTRGYWPAHRIEDFEPYWPLEQYPESRRVLESRAFVTIDTEDPGADPAEVEILRREGLRTLVMVPLVATSETIGLVELYGKGPLPLDPRRIDLLRAMCNEAAMALSNAHLYESTRALADRDPLTGFYNHRYLHERLAEEILRAQRNRAPLSLLMIDLDDFKLVNDSLGHVFGDEVLRWVADQIRDELRGSDVAARYGGDEFAVILPETSAAGARDVGQRIVAALAERPYRAERRGPVPVGASVGVATFPADGRSPATLIEAADAALYRVKRAGGQGVDGRSGAKKPAARRLAS